ncbi:hypothetical protein ACFVU3_13955 [Streptomyces sp. NPDC058052]|uniref:hypothetical protein n=1 Tax=Streptomyces sp. NPDC058052 TaxID=3346316 RepID=UPI0036F09065
MTAWVPVSCTLPAPAQPLRVAEFDALFAERLTRSARPDPLTLELVLDGGQGVERSVRDLVTQESGCCSFFTFTLTSTSDEVRLVVGVDPAHEAVLDALHAVATAAARGSA